MWTADKDVNMEAIFAVKKIQIFTGLLVWNQHNDQLPVGLLAQLVEQRIGIAEVMGLSPVVFITAKIACIFIA